MHYKKINEDRPELPEDIVLEENVYVTMRDGIKLAVDIYRPKKEGNYPALLSMSPYLKEIQRQPPMMSHCIEAGSTPFYVAQGYVHIIASTRGTGLSQGQYNLLDKAEQQDGYDLVEWAAEQSWCDGGVGLFGDSYFAVIQMLVAAQKPPHLKCIVPYDGFADLYRSFCYPGGQFYSWFLSMWGVDVLTQAAWPGPIEGKLPPGNFLGDIAANPEDGPYYWERSARAMADQVEVPMLHIVPRAKVHSPSQLTDYPAFINAPKKLIIVPEAGQFAHVLFEISIPLNQYMLRWLDHWLKGKDTGIMDEPEVAIFDSGTDQWSHENQYPLARTQWTKLYLGESPAGPASAPPFGRLSFEAPRKNEKPDQYSTPDQHKVMMRQPVLAYSSAPQTEDLKVHGPLSAVLYGSTTTTDTVWYVKVGDVDPEGNTHILGEGQLKASYREVDKSRSLPGQPFHPCQKRQLPEAGKIYEYQINLMPIFHTFKPGHKIWFQIQSDHAEHQTLIHTIYTSELLPAGGMNKVYHDQKYSSHLLLPVIAEDLEIVAVKPPLSELKRPPFALRH